MPGAPVAARVAPVGFGSPEPHGMPNVGAHYTVFIKRNPPKKYWFLFLTPVLDAELQFAGLFWRQSFRLAPADTKSVNVARKIRIAIARASMRFLRVIECRSSVAATARHAEHSRRNATSRCEAHSYPHDEPVRCNVYTLQPTAVPVQRNSEIG